MVKKLLAIFVSASMLFSFTACGEKREYPETISDVSSAESSSTADVSMLAIESNEETTKKEESKAKGEVTGVVVSTKNQVTQQNNAHTHKYAKKITASTCTQKGYTTYTCRCGSSYVSDYINKSNHTYEKYKCTNCGVVDKTHSYDYLAQWLLDNGTVFGEYAFVGGAVSDNISVDIRYYPNDESIAFKYYNNNIDGNGTPVLTMVYIYSNSQKAYYISGNDYCKITGRIDMSKYTSNFPLSYETCEAGPYTEYSFVENTRKDINYLLEQSEKLLSKNNVGITLYDLGFKSF